MKILVCNVGSTSLKFKLYEMPACEVLAQGAVERVGSGRDAIVSYNNNHTGARVDLDGQDIPDYQTGIEWFLQELTEGPRAALSSVEEIERVGFKATLSKGHFGVHEIDEAVLDGMKEWLPMAPLHNAAYIKAIEVMREVLPEARFVGAFETASIEKSLWNEKFLAYHMNGTKNTASRGWDTIALPTDILRMF